MVQKLFKTAAQALALLILAANPLAAQTTVTPAASPCDPNYFESLKSRAWMEAQREITQNQNLIFKPDSVFEYTCFDKFADELADHAKDMFSETQRWGPIPGITIDSMDTALNNLIGTALIKYIDQNFDKNSSKPPEQYDLLGGRLSPRPPNDSLPDDKRFDYTPKPIQGHTFDSGGNYKGVEYDCNMMNRVWMEAKCMDFIDSTENDGFYTFQEYRDTTKADKDKRFLPSVCKDSGGRLYELWKNEILKATVNADPPDGTPWKEDLVQLFFDKVDPVKCADATPIPTGVIVNRPDEEPTQFGEGVCAPSSCYANPTEKTDPTTGKKSIVLECGNKA